ATDGSNAAPTGTVDKLAEPIDHIAISGTISFSGTALTDSKVTTTGATSDQVTLTWTKPTKYISTDTNNGWKAALKSGARYTINVYTSVGAFVKTIDAGTKTSFAVTTGLTANTGYKFDVITDLTLTHPTDRTVTAEPKTDVVITTGEFKTAATGNAAAVTVGPPTAVKAAYTKGGSKPASVKVTWTAPAYYTGGYKVTLTDLTNGTPTNVSKLINSGGKLEFVATVGTDIADKSRYKVIVEATAANKIASTLTYVDVGAVPVTPPVAPAVPKAPETAALANVPGGTTVTLAPADTETLNPTVGFYVGVGTAIPTTVTFTDLVYVPKATSGSTTVKLKVGSADLVYAFAVAADGTNSATGAISAAAAAITTDVAATSTANVYPAANDVKNVTVVADKNDYTVKWTAAKDYFSGEATAAAPTATTDFKYVVTGYRITATIKNGATAGPSEVQYVAATGAEATFTNLRWNTKYDFKVEALVTYTPAVSDSAWDTTPANIKAMASAGATKTGVSVAKVPAVADAITVAEKSNTNTGTDATVTISGTVVGTSYIVTVTDANKAVLGTKTIAGAATSTDVVLSDVIGSSVNLTPNAKYTVLVQTIGTVPGTVSKGKSVTITATNFVTATLKDSKATKINEISIDVVVPAKGAGTGDKYYIEYTNVVDAKGKPDWNAAKVWLGTDYQGDPEAVSATITIGRLDPNSQYYFRVVTVDKAWTSSDNWSKMEKVATGKEIKIKTAAVPLPTVAKNGFTLDVNSAFGLKLVGNSTARVDALAASGKQVLGSLKPTGTSDPLYVYTLIASQETKTDITGKLLGAKTVTAGTITVDPGKTDKVGSTEKKITDLTGEATFAQIFDSLDVDHTNFSSVKNLNVQIQVDVYYGTATGTANSVAGSPDHFTVYSKSSKIALPKWFVE
ncbi:MAG: hypothetical protein LBP87_03355, partial [Planctomycetaceae bacterium]|nr:hypothetical protein [Planctomycetaceae bacterium]